MFSYYGSKCKIARHYPAPMYNIIIEPFAGAAWYSFLHKSKSILLNDKNSVIYGIWDWLINECSAKTLLSNSDLFLGQDIGNLKIDERHKNLLGFCINRGSVTPKNIVQKWSCQVESDPKWASTVSYQIKRMADNIDKIKHWKAINLDYTRIPNLKATWFVDPPYEYGGQLYPENIIDYKELSEWCKSRIGQVIVCENSKAKWLPFKPLTVLNGQRGKTVECIWHKF